MKRLLSFALLLATAGSLYAQQLPLYTQYYNNEFLYNPSQTLTEETSSLHMYYRQQWIQAENSALTQGIVFQTPIMAEKIGLGVNLINDRYGIFDRTGVSMAYSYQVDLNTDHKLLLGLSAGYMQVAYNWDDNTDFGGDPRLLEALTDQTSTFDASFGFTYAWKDLEVGIAVPHLLEDMDLFTDPEDLLYFDSRHYLGSASYQFRFNKIGIRPLVLTRWHPAVDPQIDANLVFDYDDKFWLAGGYRFQGAYTFGAGVKLHDRLNIGYSYDLNANSDIQANFGSTHEIVLGVRFGAASALKNKKDDEPEIDTMSNGEPKPKIEDLLRRIKRLESRLKEQADSLTDHEERIGNLELETERDSLKETMKKILEDMEVGSGSFDVRNPDEDSYSFGEGSRPVVNPDDKEAPFGYNEDGEPIKAYDDYKGKVYKDAEGKEEIPNPNSSESKEPVYDKDGNKITDLSEYDGPVYNRKGEKLFNSVAEDPSTAINKYPIADKSELLEAGIRYTAPGNYVIVGSFRSQDYAVKMRENLQEQGVSAGIVYNHYRRWFYVYALETDDFEEALVKLREYKQGEHPDSWIHVIVD